MKKALLILLTSVIAFHCGHNNEIKKKIPAAKFRLADGTPISSDSTDEYNPAVVITNDSHAILVFGSDRSYSGQAQSGKHNLFIAKSVSAVDFYTGIPAFNTPNVVKLSTVALEKNDRINFAVRYVSSSDEVEIYFTDSSDSKVKKTTLSSSSVNTGVGSSSSTIFETDGTTHRQGTVLSVFNKTESMANVLYRSSNGNLVLFDPDNPVSGIEDSLSNTDIGSKSSVSFVPDYVSGISKSYFFTAWDSTGTSGGQIMAAEGDSPTGAPRLLNEALENNGLVASNVAAFTDPYFYLTGFAFSAGSTLDGQQDLYAVNSHDLYGLWLLTLEDFLFIDVPDFFLGTPQIVFANFSSVTSTEAVLEIYFDQPVFGDDAFVSALSLASFNTNFGYNNGGQGSSLAFNGTPTVESFFGGSAQPGDTSFKITIPLTGTRTGVEFLEIAPYDDLSIYGYNGSPMSSASTFYVYFPGALAAPSIVYGEVMAGNTFAVVVFDQGVWGTASSALSSGALKVINYQANGGCAICSVILGVPVQIDQVTSLSGGEQQIMVPLTISDGSLTGSETFEIVPFDGSSIFNGDNSPMSASETTGPLAVY